jgi:hypothetical protein
MAKLTKSQKVKFDRLYKKFHENLINGDEIKVLYLSCYKIKNNVSLNNIPQNVEILIIDYLNVSLENIPIGVKKIIFEHIDDEKKISKVPFGCEIVVFDHNVNYSEYYHTVAFSKFIIENQKIKVSDCFTCFSTSNSDLYFARMSLQKLKGVYSYQQICQGKYLCMESEAEYISYYS